MKNIIIRTALPQDIDALLALMQEFATHLEGAFDLKLERDVFAEQLMDEDIPYTILVIETEDKLVGYASLIFQFSIWKGKSYTYLDDLFIQPAYRGLGVGADLMNRIKEEARSRNMEMVKWEVQIENHRGREFYERLGAKYREAGLYQWDLG